MDAAFIDAQAGLCRTELLDDIVPFWLAHGRDADCGGYVTCLGRDGTVYERNKVCMWNSGRISWFFSHLYNELDPRAEWLGMARHGIDFALAHAFGSDGRMYYSLTPDGRPLEPSQDVFTELFQAAGFSEYARAAGEAAMADRARDLLRGVWARLQRPNEARQPLSSAEEPVRQFGHALIALNVLQEFRRGAGCPGLERMVDQCLRWILDYHVDSERQAAFELVLWEGGPAPGHWGRWLNPGHMIEAGIFVIHEACDRGDSSLERSGLDLIEWGFQRGWDEEHGGIFNDVDIDGVPLVGRQAYVGPRKLWWQHAEALYGLLLAYVLTGEERFRRWYEQVRQYCAEHFVDPIHGEWFAILDRRGNRMSDAKGTSRKSIYHIGRNLLWCSRLPGTLDRWGRVDHSVP